MSRALVLGGGGAVGIGWQAGLLTGLADAGASLGDADVVIGTSAGSVVGAQLTSDRPLAGVVAPFGQRPPWLPVGVEPTSLDLDALFAAASDSTVTEDEFIATFGFLRAPEWPEAFRCTAFALETGTFAVWDDTTGVEVHRAVASSCSLPGLAPGVTIAGMSYIDGGARDMLNADLAIGHDTVVAVSCLALHPPADRVPELLAGLLHGVHTRIDELRASGSAVEVIEPSNEVCELGGWGAFLLDHMRTAAAFDAGRRQGAAEAARLGPFWSAR
jgi:NTE family protein